VAIIGFRRIITKCKDKKDKKGDKKRREDFLKWR
jgi:hypothetical protein